MIPGKSPAPSLAEDIISTHECIDWVPFESLTPIPQTVGAGRSLSLEEKELMWQGLKSH